MAGRVEIEACFLAYNDRGEFWLETLDGKPMFDVTLTAEDFFNSDDFGGLSERVQRLILKHVTKH